MALQTLESLDLHVIDSGDYLQEEIKRSKLAELAKNYGPIDPTGTSVGTVSGVVAYGVGEGKAKTTSGTTGRIVLKPNKLVSAVVLTEEVVAGSPRLESALWDEMVSSQGKGFDDFGIGTKAKPADWGDNFKSLSEVVNEVEIGAGQDAVDDLLDAENSVRDAEINAYLVSSGMLSHLRKQRNAAGFPLFDISNGEINGVPYVKYASVEPVLYAANWNRVWFSFENFADRDGNVFRVVNQGSIDDADGTTHNLTAENKYAIIKEDMVALAYDESAIVRVVVAETTGV